ncbi:MAG: response regulator transcription factor [Bacteroidetes bacterium]|nr:response regulator transcription factor [Bacteroidota bacterium]MBS1686991.1 response regulator transcription factor [Bacteroidota bacterium]
MRTGVFIVDDHFLVIEGIRSMLSDEAGIDLMGHAYNAEACLTFLQHHQPDVILMDINLGDMSGIDLCRQVTEKYPAVRIIGLSSYKQLSFITQMLSSGALGYVLKNATKQEILSAIDLVLQGRQYLSLEASEMMKNTQTDDVPVLTRRETEVLHLIANGLTNAEMAAQLFVSPTTIDTHRKHLLEKFNARNTAILIRRAIDLRFI